VVVDRCNYQNRIRCADGRRQRSGTYTTVAQSPFSAPVGGPVDTCSAAPFQFLDQDTPVAAVVAAMREDAEFVVVVAAVVAAAVAAMREDTECVAVVAAVVAEDKERAVAATLGEDVLGEDVLGEDVQGAAHCVASVVGPAGGIDSVGDAGEAATHDGGDVCDFAFDLSVLFLSCHLYSARSKYIPQQRARVHRG
jgi:hypothetical protein